jgi:hypothetical protein
MEDHFLDQTNSKHISYFCLSQNTLGSNTLWDSDTAEITQDRNNASEDYDFLAGNFPSSST